MANLWSSDASLPAQASIFDFEPDREANRGEGYQIRPFYLCVDVSGSMGQIDKMNPPWPIDLINHDLAVLLNTLKSSQELCEVIKLAIVSFADTAKLELPLLYPDYIQAMPRLQAYGNTSYVQPLHKLRDVIDTDYQNRKPNRWYRPVVLFITDGYPNQEPDAAWQAARDALLNPRWKPRPILVVFGFGDAKKDVIEALARGQKYTGLACIAARGQTPESEIGRIMQSLQKSIVETASNPAQFGIEIPENYIVLSRPVEDNLG